MCDPVTVGAIGIATSVIGTGLGVYGAISNAQAAQEKADYQYSMQQAQAQFEFSQQQMQMEYAFQEQLRVAESNYQTQITQRNFEYQNQLLQFDYAQQEQQRQFEYQQAVNQQNYDYQMAQAESQRAFEEQKRLQQESVIQLNADLAGYAYANDLRQLDVRFMQEEAAAAQQKLKGAREAAQARAEIRASGKTGNTVDNLIADFYRQQGMYDFAVGQNLAFTGLSLQEQKRGAQATYAGRMAGEQSYIKQPIVDPIKGIAYQGSAGPAPLMGPMPIKQSVTRGVVAQSPIYKSYVKTTPYYIEAAGALVSGIGKVAKASVDYSTAKASQPTKPSTPGRTK